MCTDVTANALSGTFQCNRIKWRCLHRAAKTIYEMKKCNHVEQITSLCKHTFTNKWILWGVHPCIFSLSLHPAHTMPLWMMKAMILYIYHWVVLMLTVCVHSKGLCLCGERQKHTGAEVPRVPMWYSGCSHRHKSPRNLLQGGRPHQHLLCNSQLIFILHEYCVAVSNAAGDEVLGFSVINRVLSTVRSKS